MVLLSCVQCSSGKVLWGLVMSRLVLAKFGQVRFRYAAVMYRGVAVKFSEVAWRYGKVPPGAVGQSSGKVELCSVK